MLVVFFIIIPIKQPDFSDKIFRLIPVQMLYLQNWLGYQSFVQTTAYIWVTWSLAIEEHFYLFWPALIYYMKRGNLVKFGIGYILLSAITRIVGILIWKNTAEAAHFFYYNSFSRFDELIFGGLLAIALVDRDWQERIKSIALPVLWGSLAIFITLCLIDLPNLPHPNFEHIPLNTAGYTSLSIFSAALIAIFVTHPENSIIRRVFRNKLLAFTGKYSYALYLLHIPIALILLDILWWTKIRGWKMYLLYIVSCYAVSILVSLVSWHVLEKHMLKLKKSFEYK
jgi:peptidoglycan/LPS O-acetylase OafA/YrhL